MIKTIAMTICLTMLLSAPQSSSKLQMTSVSSEIQEELPEPSVELTEYLWDIIWDNASDEVRKTLPLEIQAHACGMTSREFEYMARVIEAESDRTDSMDGKIHIASVILNRVSSDLFPDTISGVLDEANQFSTTSGGWCSIQYTETSRWAIVEAQRALADGSIPDNLLFFNSIGYNYGEPYGYIDGNYFMTY